jgi:hypothetical protein
MTEPKDANGISVLHLFEVMLLAMERRLVDKMDENTRGAVERWGKHESEHAAHNEAMVERFARLEADLTTHLDEARTRKLVTEARSKPLRTTATWLWDHWRDVVLLAIGLFALIAAITEVVTKVKP